jgi:chromate transporter
MEASLGARCWELARVFTWLGLTSFGGPAAHVALMERELVERRRWLDREELLDLIGLTQLIPGPNSTELAIAIGQRRAGLPGLLIAGACFILPAALLVGALAHGYLRFRGLPQLDGPFRLLKPAVVAVIADAMIRLIPTAARQPRLAAIFGVASALALLDVPELLVVVLGGITALGTFRGVASFAPLPLLSAAVASPPSIAGIFGYFFQVGSVLYGSGYVLLAYLRSGLVEARGWLTEAQLLDAIAVGQFTPGPVFTTATFIGYLIGGAGGAAAATLGIFAPAFLLIAMAGMLLRRLLLRPWFRPFLDGVNAASLGVLLAVVFRLGATSLGGLLPALVGLASFAVLWRWQINSAWVMGAAAALGLLVG